MLTLPTKIDWNNLNGKKWTTELRSQESVNRTCVAFGVLAVLETLLKIHYYNNPDQPLDLSEGRLWTCGHRWVSKGLPDSECQMWRDDVTVPTTEGWRDDRAMQYLKRFGVASGDDRPWPIKCFCAEPSPNTRIKDFSSMTPPEIKDDFNDVEKHLVKKGPCITERDLSEGTHCIAIVGYDHDARKYYVKDSLYHGFTELDYAVVVEKGWGWIEAFKPILKINNDDISELSELSLKIVKTGTTNPGNLVDVDPTVLPNLQSRYNASYDGASGWLSIRPESAGGTAVLPLELAVPPGRYLVDAKVSESEYNCPDVNPDMAWMENTLNEGNDITWNVYLPTTRTVGPTGCQYTKIQDGINAANAGDVIMVQNGTYNENLNITKRLTIRGIGMPVVDSRNCEDANAITLRSDGIKLYGFKVIGGDGGAGVFLISSCFCQIINNEILGGQEPGNDTADRPGWTVVGKEPKHNIQNPPGHGIYLDSASNNNLIRDNIVRGGSPLAYPGGSGGSAGIFIKSCRDNNIVANEIYGGIALGLGILLKNSECNTIMNNKKICGTLLSHGIFLDSSNKNKIISNQIISGGGGDYKAAGTGIFLESSNDNLIDGNTKIEGGDGFQGNGGNGISLDSCCSRNQIKNNTVDGGFGEYVTEDKDGNPEWIRTPEADILINSDDNTITSNMESNGNPATVERH